MPKLAVLSPPSRVTVRITLVDWNFLWIGRYTLEIGSPKTWWSLELDWVQIKPPYYFRNASLLLDHTHKATIFYFYFFVFLGRSLKSIFESILLDFL